MQNFTFLEDPPVACDVVGSMFPEKTKTKAWYGENIYIGQAEEYYDRGTHSLEKQTEEKENSTEKEVWRKKNATIWHYNIGRVELGKRA